MDEEELRVKLAQFIREERGKQGLSQQKLADAAGVSKPMIQKIEYRKTKNPGIFTLRRIFKTLKVTFNHIENDYL